MSALPLGIVTELIVRTVLIAAGTAAVLWVLRITAASVRHAAWAAVVVAMLALPLLLVAQIRMSLPVLTPAPVDGHGVVTAGIKAPPDSGLPTPDVVQSTDFQESPASATVSATSSINWSVLLLGVYLGGALLLLLRLVVGTVQANRLRRSAAIREGRLTSDNCVTPITVGWLKPVLILPRGWEQWSSEQVTVVLTHEREHARRHDPLTQWLALFNRAVFWFHPLAWWLERRLATLAEEACDAAVIAAGHSPQNYSEYLLDMARTVSRQHGRVRLVGMAMPGTGLSDRLRLILKGLPTVRMSRARLLCTVGFCAISSVVFAAGTLAERARQQKADELIKFDVVSIKPCPELPPQGGRGLAPGSAQYSPQYVHWDCATLTQLIEQAYGGPDTPLLNMLTRQRDGAPKRIRGGPSWMDSERFTIEARVSGDTNKPEMRRAEYYTYMRPAVNPALRAMLADRFQLKLRRTTEQQSMYALTVAAGGLNKNKMTPTLPEDCWAWTVGTPRNPPPGFEKKPMCGNIRGGGGGGEIVSMFFTGKTMQSFATTLAATMDRYVIDRTGVDGMFSFKLEYVEDDSTPVYYSPNDPYADRERAEREARKNNPPSGPSIFKALEGLGLKLEQTKGPAEFLQIDSVQRPKPNEPSFALRATQDTSARAQGAGSPLQQPDGSSAVRAPEQSQSVSVAQTPQGMQIKFEALSIKPCLETGEPGRRGGGGGMRNAISPGYASWGCVTLSQLIDQAYGGGAFPNNSLVNTVRRPPGQGLNAPQRIRGGPSWVENEKFAIEIRLSGDVTNLTGSQHHNAVLTAMAPALRSMLEDRFQLKLRKATEEQRMYALTAAGFNQTVSAPEKCWKPEDYPRPAGLSRMELPPPPPGWEGIPACGYQANGGRVRGNQHLEFTHISLSDLAKWLSGEMDRYVLDKTNKSGRFSFKLEFAPDDSTPGIIESNEMSARAGAELLGRTPPPPVKGDGPTIFKALETLGLKLEPTRGPAEYLQIESAQRPKPNGPAFAVPASGGQAGR